TTSTQTVVTGADGTAAAEVTSTTAGPVTVAAKIGRAACRDRALMATVGAGAVDHTQSELVVTKDNAVADGTDKNIFTATIVDANDNPIAGEAVVHTITIPDGTTTTQTVVTGADGTAAAKVTSTTAGPVTVAA